MHKRRVVVTGLGIISPLGLNVSTTWDHLMQGVSGIRDMQGLPLEDWPVRFAGQVVDFDVTARIPELRPREGVVLNQAVSIKEARRMGRYAHLALSAGLQAYTDSGLDAYRSEIAPTRLGVNIGVGVGGLPEIQHNVLSMRDQAQKRLSPYFITQVISNMPAGLLSIILNLQGVSSCSVSACASSAQSIGESMRMIQYGDVDVMLAGGSESALCSISIVGFHSMRALSMRNHEPKKASRPFDKDRDGFVMSEGAAVLVLEEMEMAKARGAKIYAELKGYGTTSDAFHVTAPAPYGEGGRRAMELALKNADLHPEQVNYINAHGTSTPIGDLEEAKAIASLFSDHPSSLYVSSTKSMTGHLLGASGALEAAFCVLALKDQCIPPTINLDTLDPKIDALGVQMVTHPLHNVQLEAVLSNSFGFGGHNVCLAFGVL